MNYNMNMNNINYNPMLYNNNNFNNFNYMNPSMNMFPMNQMMNNNMSKEDQNIFRLKYLLNNIQQNLYYVMNDINEIETILNNMRNEGLDNSPNFLLLNNQFNLMRNNFNNKLMNMNMNLNKKIKVTFRKSGFGSPGISLEIECEKNEKIKDVIKRYREISGVKEENVKFIFNARSLKLESTLEEAGIYDKSTIFVVLYH